MHAVMKRFLIAASALIAAAPAFAGAGNFTLINATGGMLNSVEIRRFGTAAWKPLPVRPPAGGHGLVQFADQDCAFDIRASVGGKPVVWTGVNLCGAKSVILNGNDPAAAWVDYE